MGARQPPVPGLVHGSSTLHLHLGWSCDVTQVWVSDGTWAAHCAEIGPSSGGAPGVPAAPTPSQGSFTHNMGQTLAGASAAAAAGRASSGGNGVTAAGPGSPSPRASAPGINPLFQPGLLSPSNAPSLNPATSQPSASSMAYSSGLLPGGLDVAAGTAGQGLELAGGLPLLPIAATPMGPFKLKGVQGAVELLHVHLAPHLLQVATASTGGGGFISDAAAGAAALWTQAGASLSALIAARQGSTTVAASGGSTTRRQGSR